MIEVDKKSLEKVMKYNISSLKDLILEKSKFDEIQEKIDNGEDISFSNQDRTSYDILENVVSSHEDFQERLESVDNELYYHLVNKMNSESEKS